MTRAPRGALARDRGPVRYATRVNQSDSAVLRWQSILGSALMVVGIGWLVFTGELRLARSNLARAIQAAAVVLMIAARITFGPRSFHAAANPTAGGLVTQRSLRAAAPPDLRRSAVFRLGTAHRSPFWSRAGGRGRLSTAGAAVRMYAEEALLVAKSIRSIATYRARTARVIPFVL